MLAQTLLVDSILKTLWLSYSCIAHTVTAQIWRPRHIEFGLWMWDRCKVTCASTAHTLVMVDLKSTDSIRRCAWCVHGCIICTCVCCIRCVAFPALPLLCCVHCVALAVLQSLLGHCCIVFDQVRHLVAILTIPTLMTVPSRDGCMYCKRSTCIRYDDSTCFTVHTAQVPRNLDLRFWESLCRKLESWCRTWSIVLQ